MTNTIVLKRRIPALDITRGIAILGTLWTNIWLFTNPNGLFGAYSTEPTQTRTELAIMALSQGKFLALLSLMFGIGMAIQHNSAAHWPGNYWRRVLLLLIDGAINYILIAEFDVLMGYAFTSAIIAYLLLTRPHVQRRLIISLGILHLLFITFIAYGAWAYPSDLAPTPTPYAHGGFWELVAFRLDHLLLFRLEIVVILFLSIAMFLLGARLYQAGVFTEEATALRRRLMIIGAIAFPVDFLLGLSGNVAALLLERYAFAPFVALGLLAVIIHLCYRWGTSGLPARLLQSVGRTALSCYLLQNLLGGFIFYGWGLGLVNHLGQWRVPATMVGYVVIAALVVASAHLWLRWFPRGPVEWTWRKLLKA